MISDVIKDQRTFYQSGATRSYRFRMEALAKLKRAVLEQELLLNQALAADLNKSVCESYLCEIGIVLDEIRFQQRHLRRWMKERRVRVTAGQLPGGCLWRPGITPFTSA